MAMAIDYPANDFAFDIAIPAMHADGAQRIVEVGIGHGNAIQRLTESGFDLVGFDHDPDRVAQSRARMAEVSKDPEGVLLADINDPSSYADLGTGFDGLVALGVLPHVSDEVATLRNMRELIKPGAQVFIEFRNALFSLFTFNRLTLEFISDDLLADVNPTLKERLIADLRPRLDMDRPPASVDARTFHNPFEAPALFADAGFTDIEVHPFHYHATMPALAEHDAQEFMDASIALEHETSGWRGLFLCSAYLVQARRP
jgi:2-polyprenyl-3-methyl-5-hydroxy-6-metoxy-1,4-benzoquinol methylase